MSHVLIICAVVLTSWLAVTFPLAVLLGKALHRADRLDRVRTGLTDGSPIGLPIAIQGYRTIQPKHVRSAPVL